MHRSKPTATALSYLHGIAKEPEQVAAAVAEAKLPQAAE